MEGLSNSDVALLSKDSDMMGGSAFFWIFALLLLAGGNFGGFGGNGAASLADLQASQNAQSNAFQLQSLANSIADQNAQMIQQNNANLVNAIQGFNNLGLQIMNQTNVLGTKLDGLSAQMSSCCCEIKTQMLQDRLSDTQAKLVTAQNAIDNANQSQYILSQLGRFVAWTGDGTATAGN